jgi:hypothetical protein
VNGTGSFWTDPGSVAANVAGPVTPAQHEMVARRRVRGAGRVAGALLAPGEVPAALFGAHLVVAVLSP